MSLLLARRACPAALLLALLLAPAPVLSAVCLDEWMCIFHWLDPAKQTEVSFDLRPLCGAADRVMQVTTPEGYKWQVRYVICGNTSTACNPSWQHSASHGNVIQDLLVAPSPGARVLDPDSGQMVDATADCEVLGHTRPEFDLLDETNPMTGGIVLKHSSLPPTEFDKYICPTDSRTGYPRERQVNINILCDTTLTSSQIVEVSFIEVKPTSLGTCIYALTLRSGAGCGVAGDPYDPAVPPAQAAADGYVALSVAQAGLPGTNFGYVLLGVFLVLAIQALWEKLYERGYVSQSYPGPQGIPWTRRGSAVYKASPARADGGEGASVAASPNPASPRYGSL